MNIKLSIYNSTITFVMLLLIGITTANASSNGYKLARPAISADFIYNSQYVEILGSNIHYVDQGEGNTVLFIHGNPTSSYLWRNIIPYVSSTNRSIALDLIGMGKSGKPNIDYTFQDHYAYLEKFIETLNLKNITLVTHDWGAALGFEYARRHQKNVVGISFFEGALPPVFPSYYSELPFNISEFFKILKDPILGPEYTLDQNAFVEQALPQLINRTLTVAEFDYYRAPYTKRQYRKPIYVWTQELPIEGQPQRNVNAFKMIEIFMRKTKLPILLLYGTPGVIVSPKFVPVYQSMFHNLETVFIGQGFHYLQEDQPDAIGYALADWMHRNIKKDH